MNTEQTAKLFKFKVKVVFRSTLRLGNLFRFNDSLEKKIHSRIFHCYRCSNCKVTYYRKNFHHFFTVSSEYLGFSSLFSRIHLLANASLKNFQECWTFSAPFCMLHIVHIMPLLDHMLCSL